MKDREINSELEHPVYGKLKVVAEGAVNKCYGCVFNYPKMCSNEPDRIHTGNCAADMRLDGQGVIFVKAEGGDNA